jgi:uncharacterized membrane protein
MIKLIALISALIMLLAGFLSSNMQPFLAGSVLYLLVIVVNLYLLIRFLRKPESINAVSKEVQKGILIDLTRGVEIAIIILALATIISGKEDFITGGLMIWIGTIITYFLSGVLIRDIGNVPLKFGYGGWRGRSKKKRHNA